MSKLKTFRLILFSYREAQHPPARALSAMAMMRAMAQSNTGVVAELEAVNGTCSHHQGLQFILDSSAPCQTVLRGWCHKPSAHSTDSGSFEWGSWLPPTPGRGWRNL